MNILQRWITGDREQVETGRAGCPSLDEILLELALFGEPTLTTMRNGWWCRLEMREGGVSMTVRSDTDHATPFHAALQCADRLSDLRKGKRT